MSIFRKTDSLVRRTGLCLVLALTLTGWSCAKSQQPNASNEEPKTQNQAKTIAVTYSATVQPILANKCVNCHKPVGPVSSIPLDTFSNVTKFVVPKNAAQSRLIQAVDGGSMSDKLTKDDVIVLKDWVNQGANQ